MKSVLKRLKRGFSLVEATIAMTILALTCILTLSIVQKASDYNKESTALDNMRQMSTNGMEIFKFADTKEIFKDYMMHYYYQLSYSADKNEASKEYYSYTYGDYQLTITTVYNVGDASFDAIVIKPGTEIDQTIFKINYRKYIS